MLWHQRPVRDGPRKFFFAKAPFQVCSVLHHDFFNRLALVFAKVVSVQTMVLSLHGSLSRRSFPDATHVNNQAHQTDLT